MSFFKALTKQPTAGGAKEAGREREGPGKAADALPQVAGVRLTQRPMALEKAEYKEQVSVDLGTIKILSAEGEYVATEEQSQYVCLLSDGRLLIAKGYESNPHVMAYVTLLARRGFEYRPIRTPVRIILNIRQQAGLAVGAKGGRAANTHTAMQDSARKILGEATSLGASDVHIRVDKKGADIFYRINGELEMIHEIDHEQGMKLIRYYYQAMADTSEETFKETMRLDARIGDRTKLPEKLNGIRIATTPTVEASLMVMRLLYEDASDSTDVCDLGFTPQQKALFEHMQEQPIGMSIISGPTGSGKSTTLQKVLRNYIRHTEGRRHVITVEDPPEYPIPGAIQTPVGNAQTQDERAEMFIAAISSAMRLDPDTIMIGEVRDLPSAQLALRAATTGHQVWTTLHANSGLAIVSRMLNIGIEPDLLLDPTILIGLIGQRLIKKLCPHCKEPLLKHMRDYDPRVLERTRVAVGNDLDRVYVTGKGCEHCRGGTAGRTVAAEIIIPTPPLCDILREGNMLRAKEHWLKEMGGMSIVQHAIEKVRSGIVDPAMAERVVGPLLI